MTGGSSDAIEFVDLDRGSERVQVRFDSDAVEPTVAVVRAMSRLTGREPTDLPPLGHYVDPRALVAVCESRTYSRQEGDVVIEFPYVDHLVTLKSYGVVDVEPLAADE